MPPGDHLVGGIDARLEALRRHGVIETVPEVVLTRPHHLHRRAAQVLGDQGRFDGEVALGLAPEAATEKRGVHHHLLGLDADGLGDVVARLAWALHRRPHLPLAARHPRGCRRRLHGGMRDVRSVVLGCDHLGSGGQRLVDVALVALDLAALLHGGFELGAVGLGIVDLVGSIVPGDLERVPPLERRPGVLGDHRNAAERREFGRSRRWRDLHDLLHARHLQGRARIQRGDLAADHRRSRYHRKLHARQHHVLTVRGLAGRDVDEIGNAHIALADVAERARFLELDLVGCRHGLRSRGLRQLAITELSPGGLVHDLVQTRLDLGGGNTPLLGRGRLQHGPRGSSALAHGLDEVADAARAVGVLVAVGLLVARRLHDAHARPVGLHLVGHDHGQRRSCGAGPHLGARCNDADDTVLADRDEHLGIVDSAVRHGRGAGRVVGQCAFDHRQLRGQHEPAGRGDAFEEPAAADVTDLHSAMGVELGHVTPPWQRRERPRGCADSSRSGTDCRPWRW